MDADQFDALAKTLGSRRDVLRGLAGAVAALVARSEVTGQTTVCLAAGEKCRKSEQCCSGGCKKRQGRRTGKCKPCAGGQVYCAGVPACLGCCTDDDCGGNACKEGTCAACPRGKTLCNGACLDCCSDNDCGGNACNEGTCAVCPRGKMYCPNVPACLGCCSDNDCGGNACIDGNCSACPRGKKLCNGACVDISISTEHCGDCNKTCNGAYCWGGTCYCDRYCTVCTRCCGIFGCTSYQCGCYQERCGSQPC